MKENAKMRYAADLTALIGRTPLLKLNKVVPHGDSLFLVKLEGRNPGGSLKDRIALNMILEAEKQGKLKPGMTLLEPTSGNTGIALAWIAAVRGYKSLLIMPESMSLERRNLLKAYGAELLLTPAHLGMSGAIDKARDLLRTRKDCFMLQQFDNPANPEARTGLADVAAGRAMTPDTLFNIMSMTKPVTAVALLMLQDDGKVSVSDPVIEPSLAAASNSASSDSPSPYNTLMASSTLSRLKRPSSGNSSAFSPSGVAIRAC